MMTMMEPPLRSQRRSLITEEGKKEAEEKESGTGFGDTGVTEQNIDFSANMA